MKVVAILTDADGKTGQRIEPLRWFLDLISDYITNGSEITVVVPGGATIKVERRT